VERDASNGYESVAAAYVGLRDRAIGGEVVREWARALRTGSRLGALPAGASVLDLGCGHGVPISTTLMSEGFRVFGVDASPSLVTEFRRRFPQALLFSSPAVACEWTDVLTGRPSLSLGAEAYGAALLDAGFRLSRQFVDEGGNHYYGASKR
jgi:hypothetical protein